MPQTCRGNLIPVGRSGLKTTQKEEKNKETNPNCVLYCFTI